MTGIAMPLGKKDDHAGVTQTRLEDEVYRIM